MRPTPRWPISPPIARAPTPTAAAEMAVPVREELLAQLGDLGLRKRRAVMRPVTLGRERLAGWARALPRPEALLAAPAQRLDDLGERARRGLGERIVVARTSLQRSAGRLSVPLLAARLARASDRLATVRLSPALLTARVAAQAERLEALRRLMQSLNPDNILDKGFVRDRPRWPHADDAGAGRRGAGAVVAISATECWRGARRWQASADPPGAQDNPEQGKLL